MSETSERALITAFKSIAELLEDHEINASEVTVVIKASPQAAKRLRLSIGRQARALSPLNDSHNEEIAALHLFGVRGLIEEVET